MKARGSGKVAPARMELFCQGTKERGSFYAKVSPRTVAQEGGACLEKLTVEEPVCASLVITQQYLLDTCVLALLARQPRGRDRFSRVQERQQQAHRWSWLVGLSWKGSPMMSRARLVKSAVLTSSKGPPVGVCLERNLA